MSEITVTNQKYTAKVQIERKENPTRFVFRATCKGFQFAVGTKRAETLEEAVEEIAWMVRHSMHTNLPRNPYFPG